MYCGDRVEPLAADRHAQRHDVQQQPPGHPQALVHIMAAVQAGVIDQPFPAGDGTRLLEVDPHDDEQVRLQRECQGG